MKWRTNKMNNKKIFEIIESSGYNHYFIKLLTKAKRGELIRDEDDINNEGFWNFTYDLGFDCDTGKNEKMFESVYNQLWKIAEKLLGDN
jgi:hypothetical protein